MTSRRRTAAVSFLSSISLDGKYICQVVAGNVSPLNKHCSKNLANLIDYNVIENKSACNSNNESSTTLKHVEKKPANMIEEYSLSFESDSTIASIKNGDELKFFRDRSETTSSEPGNSERKPNNTTKKLTHQSSFNSDVGKLNSSTESIGLLNGRGKSFRENDKFGDELRSIKPTKYTKFGNERLVLVTAKKIPFFVCSYIPYKRHKIKADIKRDINRRRNPSGSRPLSSIGDVSDPFDSFGIQYGMEGQEISYGKYLIPSKRKDLRRMTTVEEPVDNSYPKRFIGKAHNIIARCISFDHGSEKTTVRIITSSLPQQNPLQSSDKDDAVTYSTGNVPPVGILTGCGSSTTHCPLIYHPHLLDDPELIAGKHRTLMTFTSYTTSVIDYVRPSDLKKEINDKFREKFSDIKLTLSKLRSLKKEMKKIIKAEAIDLVTAAQAYVYFEKLILRGLINKENRKLCAAASLLLSAKLSDIKGDDLKSLIERTESVFRINRRELMRAEFAVLVALEFELHVPNYEIYPHYQRLLHDC